MCKFCEKEENLFKFDVLNDWLLTWGSVISKDSADYATKVVFIDRGYLRLADKDDCQCIDHGEKLKICYCPMCGSKIGV